MLDWDLDDIVLAPLFKDDNDVVFARFTQISAHAGSEEAFEYLATQFCDNLDPNLRTMMIETMKHQWAIEDLLIPAPPKKIM